MPEFAQEMEIVEESSLERVATVFVASLRNDPVHLIEFVEGFDEEKVLEEKWILNVSTQFGCPVGCHFCDAGYDFHGNLRAEEIFEQIRFLLSRRPGLSARCGKLKIHFARMGEPSLNDGVLKVLRGLRAMPELSSAKGLWACVPTVAPRNRMRWFNELLEIRREFFPETFQLQFSINTTDEAARRKWMSIPGMTFAEIAEYGARFAVIGGRKPVLNFALSETSVLDPEALRRNFPPEYFAIKITPLNPTVKGEKNGMKTILRSPKSIGIAPVVEEIRSLGYETILSLGDGREDWVGSNCGQSVRARRARL